MTSYEMAKRDYERMRCLMGDDGVPEAQVYDFTGGFVFEEHGMALLANPTKAKAAQLYVALITYGFQAGWSASSEGRAMPDLDNPEIAEIAERYGFI